ncbi:AI-2E family transporter [Pseudalkalibacillus caeni]|uniref:AI-2E family transporter n=1 Tax=Exobacillus caeni TaxID=2574798 RepID=A0A5R9F9U2_9BACL|nr:AI-2E family transporter [Pseudalkalibacillus caeni]TLS39010.1 AI-2E family transporter [Pseudalkalibacillus caeni]
MWTKDRFFKYATGILIVLVIIFFLGQIGFFLAPFKKLITTLFFPIIIAGLFYYILRPVVDLGSRFMPRTISILIVFVLILGGFYLLGTFTGNKITGQISDLTKEMPQNVEKTSEMTTEFIEDNNYNLFSVEQVKDRAINYLGNIAASIQNNIMTIVSMITSIATVLVVVPFVLFFFLRDGHKFRPFMLRFIPEKHDAEGNRLLKDIDKTLFTYIVGQFMVACVDGILMYLGYTIIGLKYAIVLALFVIITAIIPLLGPILGVVPALIVGATQDPYMMVKILIVLVIVQQLESNLVSPLILGNKLHLHPLTVILLLLVAGSLYGFIGILIAVPLYSILKVMIKNFYHFYRLRNSG